MFSVKHIIILAVCILYIIGVTIFLIRKKIKRMTVVRCLSLIGLISETLKLGTYIIENEAEYGGYLPKTDLPFHLCSIQLFFMVIILLTKSEKIHRTIFAFMMPTCLVGGIAALLIPTFSSLNMPMITVQYFLYHASIIIFALYLLLSKEISFTVKDYGTALIFLWAMLFVSVYLNSWINDYQSGVNFMYVINPPIEGLPYLNKEHGWLSYILRYALLAVFCVSLCYIKPIVLAMKGNGRRKEE